MTTDQRRQNMAICQVIVITGPIEIGGHQTNRIKAMLLSQGFELDASDLAIAYHSFVGSRGLPGLLIGCSANLQMQLLPKNNSRQTQGQAVSIMGLDLEVLQEKSAG